MAQHQSGGMGSTNLQANTVNIHTGLTYSDVKEIACDVFEANFEKLASKAKQTAADRAAEIREEIINTLAKDNANPDSFSQPEKQMALFEAQKTYALSGDETLRDTLVRTVIDLSKEPERSLKAIVLQEALKTLSTLTRPQLTTIGTVFMVRYVRWRTAETLEKLSDIFQVSGGAGLGLYEPKEADFRHIEFSRCGSVELSAISFADILRHIYPGLVNAGFTLDEIKMRFKEVGIPFGGIIQCLSDTDRLQVAALDDDVIDSNGITSNWTKDQINLMKQVLKERLMDENAIKSRVAQIGGAIAYLDGVWSQSNLKRLSLTSVGMAIGHSFVEGNGGQIADVSTWLQ